MSHQAFGPIDQLGYLVDDLDRAITFWVSTLGVGPWTVFREVEMNGHYLGQPTQVTMDVALGYQAAQQIELICPRNSAPSPYRDAAGAVPLGPHHIAWFTKDLAADTEKLTAAGCALVFTAENPVARVAYLRANTQPGLLLELIESDITRQMRDDGRIAAANWNGQNPVIELNVPPPA